MTDTPETIIDAESAANLKRVNAYHEKQAVNAIQDAMEAINIEDKAVIQMNADELVDQATRGMEEVAALRAADMSKLLEGRKHFTALVGQLTVSEADLAKRHSIYTAMLSTVEPEKTND